MKKTLVSTFTVMYALVTNAQNDSLIKPAAPSPLTITGSVDVYYRYDFAENRLNNRTSFTNSHNNFELGMATIKLEHKTSKIDMVADLGFGKRAREFSYTDDNGSSRDIIFSLIKQLYVSYSPASWVKLTAGTWATHVGYESVDAYANRNYSMSYMFTNGPFNHTGFKVDFTKGKSGFMLGLANPTDYKYVPDSLINKKFFLAQYSFVANDNFKFSLNYVMGQGTDTAKSHQFDAVIAAKINSKFNIGYNATINNTKLYENGKHKAMTSWWGQALYLNVDPSSSVGLSLRAEYFSDKNQLKVYKGYPLGGSVFATTLSANFKISSLTLIPEIRVDKASKDLFNKKDGSAASSAGNFLIAAVYQF